MKIRIGFVSNSSSSSFVVLLPKDFTPDWSKLPEIIENLGEETEESEVKECLETVIGDLMRGETVWEEGEYDFNYYGILSEFLKPYVIAITDTCSDGGQIVNADIGEIKRILEI